MMSKTRKIAIKILFGLTALLVLAYIPSTIWILNFEAAQQAFATLLVTLTLLVPAGICQFLGMYLLLGGNIKLFHSNHKPEGKGYSHRVMHNH